MKPRILWANLYCLLDRSSGASLSVREILHALKREGWDVHVLGATNFDDPAGASKLPKELSLHRGAFFDLDDGPLKHKLFVTQGRKRPDMTNAEEGAWYNGYVQYLEQFKPDIVFYYGGQPFDFLIAEEAKARGIGTAFYLVNGNYQRTRWARDIDLILTDTQATARYYQDQLGLDLTPVGTFVDASQVVADSGAHSRVLFVNPLPAKGALWVALLAEYLETRRPDIVFEVVEARGRWNEVVTYLNRAGRIVKGALSNVIVTANTDDMRPVYAGARLLLAPSLCWESGARVLAEAMLNGIPAIATDRGGAREMIAGGGFLVQLPEKYHQAPYTRLPDEAEIAQLAGLVESIYDDDALYRRLQSAAAGVGREVHSLEVSTQRLIAALQSILPKVFVG